MDGSRVELVYTHDHIITRVQRDHEGTLVLHDDTGVTVFDMARKQKIQSVDLFGVYDISHGQIVFYNEMGDIGIKFLGCLSETADRRVDVFADVFALQWSPDGLQCAAQTLFGVTVWKGYDMRRFILILPPPPRYSFAKYMHALAWSPCGTMIAAMRCKVGRSLSSEHEYQWYACVWRLRDGARTNEWSMPCALDDEAATPYLSWSPDSTRIVTSQGCILYLSDVHNRPRKIETKHKCVAWSPDGKWLVATGRTHDVMYRVKKDDGVDIFDFAWIDFTHHVVEGKHPRFVAWLDDQTFVVASKKDLLQVTLRQWTDRTNYLFPRAYRERVFAQMCALYDSHVRRLPLEVCLQILAAANTL